MISFYDRRDKEEKLLFSMLLTENRKKKKNIPRCSLNSLVRREKLRIFSGKGQKNVKRKNFS
jgi:hypothetical protein